MEKIMDTLAQMVDGKEWNAFIEAVSWAIQVANGEIKVKD